MQVAACAVAGAGDVAVGVHGGAQFLALDHADAGVAVFAVEGLDLLAQFPFLPRLDRDMHLSCPVVAVDAVAGDEFALQAQALDGDVPHPTRVRFTEERTELVLPAGDARDGLRAAAAGGAPADAVRFEEGDAAALLGEVQRGGAAGDAATDHADVRHDVALQRRARRLRRGGGGVPGVDVAAQIAPMYHSTSSGVT
jgi:hypothetical protein